MADGREKITERMFRFSVRIVRLVRALAAIPSGQILARQLMRSGTSIGANVEEAQSAQTRREFSRKLNIALGEAREMVYWLRLLEQSGMLPARRLSGLLTEADEIARILGASVKRSRAT